MCMVESMGRNFDVFSGFQQFPAMRNKTLYSVCTKNAIFYTILHTTVHTFNAVVIVGLVPLLLFSGILSVVSRQP